MLAVPGPLPAEDTGWAYEVKWDGVRAMAWVDGPAGTLCLRARSRADVTGRYPELAGLAAAAGHQRCVLDGELVCFASDGVPSFERLQHRMHLSSPSQTRVRRHPVCYLAFDLLWLDGSSTIELSYAKRREALERLGLDGPAWQVPGAHVGDGPAVLEATARRGLEGVVAKRLASTYQPGRRSKAWVKVKHEQRQELLVGGWRPGMGARSGRVGALLVGYHDASGLRYAGGVGTGFSDAELQRLGRLLAPLRCPASPFVDRVTGPAEFVEPKVVVEVAFTAWTDDGVLRHPCYKGVRDDADPAQVVRE